MNVDLCFIQELLRKFKEDDSIQVEAIHNELACGKGDNFMSIVSKISVNGKRIVNNETVDFETSVIVKQQINSQLMKDAYNTKECFLNEVVAYNEILPVLQECCKRPLPVAKCLHADENTIVLEDLTLEGYEMKKESLFMTTDECLVVVREMAGIHAASIILTQRNPEKKNMLSKKIFELYNPENHYIKEEITKFLSTILIVLQREQKCEKIDRAIEVIQEIKDDIYTQICKLFTTERDVSVFNHGDCWKNNILFSKNKNVKFIDLQLMRCTSVAADLSYLLYINLSVEDRNKNQDLFFDVYIQTLKNVLSENGVDASKTAYTKQWLEKEMREFAIFGFVISLWISPVFYFDKEAFLDLESTIQDDFFLKYMSPALKDRIVSLVLDFVSNYTVNSL